MSEQSLSWAIERLAKYDAALRRIIVIWNEQKSNMTRVRRGQRMADEAMIALGVAPNSSWESDGDINETEEETQES